MFFDREDFPEGSEQEPEMLTMPGSQRAAGEPTVTCNTGSSQRTVRFRYREGGYGEAGLMLGPGLMDGQIVSGAGGACLAACLARQDDADDALEP